MDAGSIEAIVNGALVAGGGFLAWMTGMFLYVVRRNAREAREAEGLEPRKVLEMRYVKGEITEEEYCRKLSLITYGLPLPADLPVPDEDLGLPSPQRERSDP